MFLKVSGNLLCGSGGGEGTGKANDDHVLALGVLGDVDLLNVGEALEELDGGELVTDGDVEGGGGAGVRHGGCEGGGATGQGGGEKELHGCDFGLLFNDFRRTSAQKSGGWWWWSEAASTSRETRRQRRLLQTTD